MTHDDHAHGHVKLEYHPGLPLPNGKLCMWLFLSTEIMFFAGLIGTYIVLRFGAPDNTWPAPHDVHLAEYIGAFNTFVLFQFFNILNVRSDHLTVFRRATLGNSRLWVALGAVLVLQVAVTHVGPMQRLFDTTSISGVQWLVCVAVASSVLWVEELRKAVRRRSAQRLQDRA